MDTVTVNQKIEKSNLIIFIRRIVEYYLKKDTHGDCIEAFNEFKTHFLEDMGTSWYGMLRSRLAMNTEFELILPRFKDQLIYTQGNMKAAELFFHSEAQWDLFLRTLGATASIAPSQAYVRKIYEKKRKEKSLR